MRASTSVFLDTTVLKASVDTRLVLTPESQSVQWGDRPIEVNIHRPVYVNQNVRHLRDGNRERFKDTVVLRYIAALAKERKITLVSHAEVFFELMGLPRSTGAPRFYGAPIQKVDGPLYYERIAFDWTGHDYQLEFLNGLKHPRFLQLQRAAGAFQGHDRPLNRNQLIDAFHLWCAESANADYFLTLDDALIRAVSNHKTHEVGVACTTPKRLFTALLSKHPTWLCPIVKELYRFARSGRKLDAIAQDASREFFS